MGVLEMDGAIAHGVGAVGFNPAARFLTEFFQVHYSYLICFFPITDYLNRTSQSPWQAIREINNLNPVTARSRTLKGFGDYMEYDEVVLGRRSIRGYKPEPVPQALIEEFIAGHALSFVYEHSAMELHCSHR